MLEVRKAAERGREDHGWLLSQHTFSFADYFDPRFTGFRALRVGNEDRVEAGSGFGTHGHRDMEIVSYVLDGELAHKDSMGTGSAQDAPSGVIRPGDVQRMSAGSGVRHSEFNHAKDRITHFLQIWLLPNVTGIPAEYEQKHFGAESKRGKLRLVASPDGRDGSLTLHADASISAGLFDGDESAELALDPKRRAWVQVVRGKVVVNGQALGSGDAVGLEKESSLRIGGGEQAEVLVFDLA